MKVKTSELKGAALDWAIAKCEGVECDENNVPVWYGAKWPSFDSPREVYSPSTLWEHGGPIIQREMLCLTPRYSKEQWVWVSAFLSLGDYEEVGPDPLTAAMRCFVWCKLGGEVEIPEELIHVPPPPVSGKQA